jgi:hypothetical protein
LLGAPRSSPFCSSTKVNMRTLTIQFCGTAWWFPKMFYLATFLCHKSSVCAYRCMQNKFLGRMSGAVLYPWKTDQNVTGTMNAIQTWFLEGCSQIVAA